MRVFYRPEYVMAAAAFDTTRKAAWVADSLTERPIADVELVAPTLLTDALVGQVHDPAYVAAVRSGYPRSLADSNGLAWDTGLITMVLASNGGAVAACLDALEHGVSGSLSSGLHHAKRGRGDGFCTFNGLALGVRAAQAAGAGRILLLDFDAHCGGGTWELLGDDPGVDQVDVAVSSFDWYAPRRRWTLDLVDRSADYLPTLQRRLAEVDARTIDYDLVLYNAGMDPYERCHVGGLPGIDTAMLTRRESVVFDWARGHGWPIAFVLAGGYTVDEGARLELVGLHRATIEAAAASAG
jgi:acetoin utilization deacetylase AcuC-like enzyme